MTPLTDLVRSHIETIFPPDIRDEVAVLLMEKCGANLPLMSGGAPENFDRVRCAVLKLSCGNFVRLVAAVADANTDWRDTLMAAGFGHDVTAHESWRP